jgi:hypothetical protein
VVLQQVEPTKPIYPIPENSFTEVSVDFIFKIEKGIKKKIVHYISLII